MKNHVHRRKRRETENKCVLPFVFLSSSLCSMSLVFSCPEIHTHTQHNIHNTGKQACERDRRNMNNARNTRTMHHLPFLRLYVSWCKTYTLTSRAQKEKGTRECLCRGQQKSKRILTSQSSSSSSGDMDSSCSRCLWIWFSLCISACCCSQSFKHVFF